MGDVWKKIMMNCNGNNNIPDEMFIQDSDLILFVSDPIII